MTMYHQKLKEHGFKLTPQRLAIVNYLEGNTSHPTALSIFNDLKQTYPTMSMATVYNTLNVLHEVGLVREYKFNKDRVHYDPDLSEHHHFSCTECHGVCDIHNLDSLPQLQNFEQETGHHVEFVSILVYGKCQQCLQQQSKH